MTYLWQVALHSFVAAAIFYAWSRRQELPSGRTKRWALAVLLILPLVTAAVPGRGGDFPERHAWLDSGRLLALPLGGPVRVAHLVWVVGAAAIVATLAQEVLGALRRPRPDFDAVPDELVERVRALPGAERCRVGLLPSDASAPVAGRAPAAAEPILLVTGGRPGRPTLLVSSGALAQLDDRELAAALAHERAHWRPGRWWTTHLLFAARLLQIYNPVALWVFREYTVEVEIDCDREAVAGADPRPLGRALMRIYRATDRRDLAARRTLRRRIDLLLATAPDRVGAPGPAAVVAGAALLAVLLPWIV